MKSAEQQREAQEAHPVLRADTAAIMQQQADASPRDSNPGDQTQGEEGDTTQTQAVEILASLASLGISSQLRERVQEALSQLQQVSDVALQGLSTTGNRGAPSSKVLAAHNSSQRTTSGGGASLSAASVRAMEASYQKKLEALEGKLSMSRSIMRKLYHKNVALEKEMQVLSANKAPINYEQSTSHLLAAQQQQQQQRPGTAGGPPNSSSSQTGAGVASSPMAQALQERDRTIAQLQQALDAARRRCSLLEGQIASASLTGGNVIVAGKGKGGAREAAGIREILAQSQVHFQKYRQIREDYNRLLYKRAGSVQTSKAASAAAKSMLDEMQARLRKEVAEREAEAAMYSSRLYESERQLSDWYVEKRMLEDHIARLREEVAARDRLDQEIESCVAGLFERLRLLEASNEDLRGRLTAAGVDPGAPPQPDLGASQ